jgi:CBS domain containing-hemolysin-like protein
MVYIILAICATMSTSAVCSLLEAMVLSTSVTEIEELKKKCQKRGELLEKFKTEIGETSSAILSLNTMAMTLGAMMTGVLVSNLFGGESPVSLVYFPVGMTIAILLFSEILPKNIGVIYRKGLHQYFVYPLLFIRVIMYPLSFVGKMLVYLIIGKHNVSESGDAEIILLAERSEKDGTLTKSESRMISNTLSLDDIIVRDIMTPRTVVTALEKSRTVDSVFKEYPDMPFSRMPVYDDNIDNIVGVVRRRDLLKALAKDNHSLTAGSLMEDVIFLPENVSATDALQKLLSSHQQLAIAVDEYGSVSGVITLEDIVEHILGQEIFEKDDLAVDMRELARKKQLSRQKLTS